jgi:hypothetical protein
MKKDLVNNKNKESKIRLRFLNYKKNNLIILYVINNPTDYMML